jgi:type I restriction enzyme M protein
MTEPRRTDVICDPGVWDGRASSSALPSTCAATTRTPGPIPDARLHVETVDVPRSRLSTAPCSPRSHEHGPARVRGRGDRLPRLAHRGARGRGRSVLAHPREPALCRKRWTTEAVAKDLIRIVNTRKTELLFLALFLRLLKRGGRAAVIVPDGVLCSGRTRRTRTCAGCLMEEQQLQGRRQAARRRVPALCRGDHRHPAVPAHRLRRHPTACGSTTCMPDGLSLDDKRNLLVPENKLGPWAELTEARGRA